MSLQWSLAGSTQLFTCNIQPKSWEGQMHTLICTGDRMMRVAHMRLVMLLADVLAKEGGVPEVSQLTCAFGSLC